MRILFVSCEPHLPQRFGGAFVSTHDLAHALLARGHDVAVLARLVSGGKVYWGNRLKHWVRHKQFPVDRALGYPVYRGWGADVKAAMALGLKEAIADFSPDVVVAQGGQSMSLAVRAVAAGVPGVAYLRDVEFDELDCVPPSPEHIGYLANSTFTADKFHSAYGLRATVIPPVVNTEHYRVKTKREAVLYVNPVPKKGQSIALAMAAARPDIPFIFQESWVLAPQVRLDLERAVQDLPNVELRPPLNDMRQLYGRARILLVPSQWEEAWGRVATEAQISGIPVLASDRGGLPESVGDGGLIVAHEAPIHQWTDALTSLWDDRDRYKQYSSQAFARSTRPEIQPDFLLSRLEAVLRDRVYSNGAPQPGLS